MDISSHFVTKSWIIFPALSYPYFGLYLGLHAPQKYFIESLSVNYLFSLFLKLFKADLVLIIPIAQNFGKLKDSSGILKLEFFGYKH